MAQAASRLTLTRRRLARQLSWQALAGLTRVAAMMLLLMLAALISLAYASDAFLAGHWPVTMAWLSLVAAMMFAAWRIFCWLMVPIDLPVGICLAADVAPRFHHLIKRVGERFGGIDIDYVWITGDVNAAVLQRPRWGNFGPMETHLLVGLPLAHSVSPKQLAAILAHEFAHLKYQRQGWAGWGCFLRSWWFRTIDGCIDDLPHLAGLLNWLSAGFVQSALQLARLEEFEADRVAARVVGARRVGDALIEVALKERFLSEDYWHKVMAQSIVQPTPTIRPYREMAHGMIAGFRRPADRGISLVAAMGQNPEAFTIHPSLSQRLQALGVQAETLGSDTRSAADHYLSPILPKLSLEFDRAWWMDTRRVWRYCYRRSRRLLKQQA